MYFRITLLYITGQEFIKNYRHLFTLVTVFGLKVTSITAPPGFGYTLLLVRRNAIGQERYHGWHIPLVSWVPPETFQTFTFTSNDNKDAEYMCFRYKNMLNKVFRYSGF